MPATTNPTDTDEQTDGLCDLCWTDHTASFHAPEYRNGVDVCGVHANALEDGSWDHGQTYEVDPITVPATADTDYEYIFAYGTLHDGTGAAATLTGFRMDTSGRHPVLIPNPDGTVDGELHKVTPERLAQLDTYEGVPRLAKRVEGPLGVYVYLGDPSRLGAHGRLQFDHQHLEACMQDAHLTLAPGVDPRDLPVEADA